MAVERPPAGSLQKFTSAIYISVGVHTLHGLCSTSCTAALVRLDTPEAVPAFLITKSEVAAAPNLRFAVAVAACQWWRKGSEWHVSSFSEEN